MYESVRNEQTKQNQIKVRLFYSWESWFGKLPEKGKYLKIFNFKKKIKKCCQRQ